MLQSKSFYRRAGLVSSLIISLFLAIGSIRAIEDETPPSIPQRVRATAASQASMNVAWQPSYDFESEIDHYDVERDGAVVASPADPWLLDGGLFPQTAHTYRIRAVNGAGLISDWSAPASATTLAPPASPFPSLAQRGTWSWFGDPRAVQVGSKTYTGWIDWNGDVVVAQYDNPSRRLITTVVRPALEVDDHDNPSVVVRTDGRLLVFYSKHAGSPMYYRLSTAPGDITTWEPEQTVPGTAAVTYPNPFFLSDENNALYLFWRGGDGKPTYAVSADGGETWNAPQTLIDIGPYTVSYVKYASDGRGQISLAFTDTHPEKSALNNVYHITYRDGAFYRADGTLAKTLAQLPLTPADADVVFNAAKAGVRGWIWDIALDAKQRPVLAYTTFPSTNDHRYHYARWTGSTWFDRELTSAGGSIDESGNDPYYSAGIALDPNDPSILYLARQAGSVFELERWATLDGGASWFVNPVTVNSAAKNLRPFVPRNHQPNSIGLLWLYGGYRSYTQYETRPVFRLDPSRRGRQTVAP